MINEAIGVKHNAIRQTAQIAYGNSMNLHGN